MATRRKLTAEEQHEAERLASAWVSYKAENKGANQTWLAAESGLGTQGAVGQYLRAIIPLNLDALLAICRVIQADPKKISPRLTSKIDGSIVFDAKPKPQLKLDIGGENASWPFRVSRERFDKLGPTERAHIDGVIEGYVVSIEQKAQTKSRRAS